MEYAIAREGPGGNSFARIPSWWGHIKGEDEQGCRCTSREKSYGSWDQSRGTYPLYPSQDFKDNASCTYRRVRLSYSGIEGSDGTYMGRTQRRQQTQTK